MNISKLIQTLVQPTSQSGKKEEDPDLILYPKFYAVIVLRILRTYDAKCIIAPHIIISVLT